MRGNSTLKCGDWHQPVLVSDGSSYGVFGEEPEFLCF